MTDGLSLSSAPFSFAPSRGADLFVATALTIGAMMVGLELWYLAASHFPYGPEGYVVGRDFLNTWMGGRIALTGDPTPWFDFNTYNAALKAAWGPHYPDHIWSYPPDLLLLTWPFALIPYLPSFAVWIALGLGVYVLAAVEGEWRWQTVLLAVVSPAVVMNIFTGQNGFFTAALLIGGLTSLDRRPWIAGILFGILTIKPQLGVLLPLMLVLTGRWRVIAAAAVTTVILIGASCIAFGPGVWKAYHDVAMADETHVILHGAGLFVLMMPTVFMNARAASLPLEVGWVAQGIVSAATVAMVAWAYWKPRDPVLSLALLVTASFVVTPYVFNYDMVIFGWLFARLIARGGNTACDYVLMLAVWTLPVTTIGLGLFGVPGSALVLIAFAGRLAWRLRGTAQGAASGVPAAVAIS